MDNFTNTVFDTCLERILGVFLFPIAFAIFMSLATLILGFQELIIIIFGESELLKTIIGIGILVSCIPTGLLTMLIYHQIYIFLKKLATGKK